MNVSPTVTFILGYAGSGKSWLVDRLVADTKFDDDFLSDKAKHKALIAALQAGRDCVVVEIAYCERGEREKVAKSIADVEAARRLLAQASEELSPVPGYAEEWTAINDAWRNVGELSDLLEARGYEIARHTLRLDADDGGGPRYKLGEKPVHAGTELEVLLDDEWIAVRFEWTHRLDDLPLLYRDDGGSIPLLESSETNLVLFRWPGR